MKSLTSYHSETVVSRTTVTDKKDDNAMQKLQDYVSLQEGKSCSERLVISIDNGVYQVWKVFVVFMCLSSSLMNAYFAAFGVPAQDTIPFWILVGFETGFAIDIVVNFLLEFIPEDQ